MKQSKTVQLLVVNLEWIIKRVQSWPSDRAARVRISIVPHVTTRANITDSIHMAMMRD